MDLRQTIKGLASEGMRKKYRQLRELVIKAEFKLFGLFKTDRSKVVFCNVWGYGDNPRWIAGAYVDYLEREIRAERSGERRRELKKRLNSIYFVTGQLPEADELSRRDRRISFVKNNSLHANFELATAGVWVDCNRKERYIKKRRGQCYIQTWHGGLPLKKIEGDCPEALPEGYAGAASQDTAMTDIYISNSDFCKELYRRAFGFKGKILCLGSPRMDVLLRPDHKRREQTRARILSRINKAAEASQYKICLYAPTYRDGHWRAGVRENGTDETVLAKALEKRFGAKFIFVSRLHPLAMSRTDKKCNVYLKLDNEEYVVDGNCFGDSYELMEAADVLITDYSNTLFEFAQAGRPVFLYAPDAAEYERTRGMYFKYAELPYPVATTKAGLYDIIMTYNAEEYRLRQRSFFEQLSIVETGRASDKIARLINGIMDKK